MNKRRFSASRLIIAALLVLWGVVIIYPFYSSLLTSIMTEREFVRSQAPLFVKEPTLEAYRYVLTYPKIWSAYKSTFIILLFGIPLNIFLTTTLAYALTRPEYPFKKAINNLIVFTMYFSGGMIPSYLLIRSLGLMNSYASIIFAYGINTYYLIIAKSFFATIPESLEEAARIDGANDLVIFWRIFLPLTKPIMATLFLFYAVDRWNEWFNAMLYITDGAKWPLQLVLRDMIGMAGSKEMMPASISRKVFPMGIKMAVVVVTMLPIMLVYPFLQKYFIKGMLIGAVKS